MSDLEIREVDARDEAAFAAFHATYWAAMKHDLDGVGAAWTLPEMRVGLLEPNRRYAQRVWAGLVGGDVVATGFVGRPLLDNPTAAQLEVATHPAHRRRGYGAAMLAHLEAVVDDAGRTRLESEATWPTENGASGAGWPAVEFATASGYALTIGDVERELALPVDEALLAELVAETAPHHTAYELRTWVGRVPDELAHSWMSLSSTLMTEAPMGDTERDPEVVDVAALREGEATVAKQGRERYCAVALDADGEVVAYSDMVSTVHEPGRVYQWGTLVRRAERGHRLGMAVKLANLQLVQRERPDLARITTWNAEVNSHMISVNERLGFRPVARLGEFTKRTD